MIVFVALFMVMSMASKVDAADETYTITISNAVKDETYSVYKIFDATISGEAVAYTINKTIPGPTEGNVFTNPVWTALVGTAQETDGKITLTEYNLKLTKSAGDANVYVVTPTQSIKEGETVPTDDVVDAIALANALKNASSTLTKAVEDIKATGTTVTFGGLSAGYYFVDTSLGSLCALDTAKNVTIYEKNTYPTIDKLVKNKTDNDVNFAKAADADFGDVVTYKLTVNTGTDKYASTADGHQFQEGTGIDKNYVISDTLPTGITTTAATINVVIDKISIPAAEEGGTSTEITWTENTDYTVSVDGQKVLITLLNGTESALALNKVPVNTDIIITFDALVTKDAKVEEKNQNTVELTYSEQKSTSSASVWTWKFDIKKVDESGKALAGAEFKLQEKGTGETYADISVISTGEANTYRKALTGETGVATVATDATGILKFEGFDSHEYQLVEVKAPEGYNPLPAPEAVVITATAGSGENAEDMTKSGVTTATIEIENKAGVELPSTGGIGTTIFHVVGAALVLGAGIILVSKKRING